MKKTVLLIILSISFSGFSQKVKDSIYSKKMNSNFKLSVSVPESYNKNTKKTYPLLLLLDGDYLFDAFNGALSFGNYWDDLPEAIIVGIHQNNETEREENYTIDETTGLPFGKGNSFFEFIGDELMPYIEKKYKIGNFKMIAGHDVTAGYINTFLYKESPLFNAYVCLSPELSTEMENRIPERLASQKQNIFYYLSTASGDIEEIKDEASVLNENIKAISSTNLNYRFDEIKEASHYSLVLYSIPNVLYQFFDSYHPISTNEFQEKIVVLPSGYVDYLKNKYDFLEKTIGVKIPIRINDFKAIEAAILKNKAYKEFELLAQLANKTYPKSMLGHYHMGKFYENTGEIKKAIKSYQNGFIMESIGDLTKDLMLEIADELKGQNQK